jgi:hypothetical protein
MAERGRGVNGWDAVIVWIGANGAVQIAKYYFADRASRRRAAAAKAKKTAS